MGLRRAHPLPPGDPPLHDRRPTSNQTHRRTAPSPPTPSIGSPTRSPAPPPKPSPSTRRRRDTARRLRGDHDRVGRQTRLLADQRQTLEKERAQKARELHRARRELAGLGAIGRARHGRTLREQISEREEALTHFDRELDRTERQLHESRQRALEIARTRTRLERGPTRERSLERSIERERGLEL